MMTNLFTEDGVRLFTTREAAHYINDRLPEDEKWERDERLSENVYWHILNGRLSPYSLEDDQQADRKKILITQTELDRFLAHRPRRGKGRKIDLTPYEPRMGHEPDPQIARDAGCSSRTVKRWREKKSIPPYTG